jgi:protein involved in polysaccharide export with SLBB domain
VCLGNAKALGVRPGTDKGIVQRRKNGGDRTEAQVQFTTKPEHPQVFCLTVPRPDRCLYR